MNTEQDSVLGGLPDPMPVIKENAVFIIALLVIVVLILIFSWVIYSQNSKKNEHIDLTGLTPIQKSVLERNLRADPLVSKKAPERLVDPIGLNPKQLAVFNRKLASDPLASREFMVDTTGLSATQLAAVQDKLRADPLTSREYLQNKSEVPELVKQLY